MDVTLQYEMTQSDNIPLPGAPEGEYYQHKIAQNIYALDKKYFVNKWQISLRYYCLNAHVACKAQKQKTTKKLTMGVGLQDIYNN